MLGFEQEAMCLEQVARQRAEARRRDTTTRRQSGRQARDHFRAEEKACVTRRKIGEDVTDADRSFGRKIYEQILQEHPTAPEAEHVLSYFALRPKSLAHQEAVLEQLRRGWPHSRYRLEAEFDLAQGYTDAKRPKAALRVYDWIVAHGDHEPHWQARARFQRGVLHYNAGRFAQARRDFMPLYTEEGFGLLSKRAMRGTHAARRALWRAVRASHACDTRLSAKAALRSVRRIWPQPKAGERLTEDYIRAGRPTMAVKVWRQLIKENPGTDAAAGYQANIITRMRYQSRRDWHIWFDFLYRQARGPSGGERAWSHLRRAAFEVQLPDLAEYAHRTLSETPRGAHLHGLLLGEMLFDQGRWDEAIAAYKRSIEGRPAQDTNVEPAAMGLIWAHRAKLEEAHGPLMGQHIP